MSEKVAYRDPLECISEQQGELLDRIADGYNVKLEALPGCGKTTFICQVAAAFPEKNILVLSYNKSLVRATNRALKSISQRQNATGWVICKTYHGLATALSGEIIKDDIGFKHALVHTDFTTSSRRWPFKDVHMLIVDEAQDMRRIYFRLLLEAVLSVCLDPLQIQWCVLGDVLQVLYEFFPVNKADRRFLLLIQHIVSHRLSERPWFDMTLNVSYRLTPQMAHFLNALVPGCNIESGKTRTRISDWVTLTICDIWRDAAQAVYNIVKRERAEHPLHEIMILLPSVTGKSPATHIVDLLVANDIPVHVERSGDLAQTNLSSETHTSDVTRNKVNVRSIHSSKGLEKEVVIWFNIYELLSEDCITNPQFVGGSRANTRLYVMQHYTGVSQQQVDTLAASMTQADLRIIVTRPLPLEHKERKIQETETGVDWTVSSLFSFLDVAHMEILLEHIEYEVIIPDLEEGEEDTKIDTEEEDEQHEHNAYIEALTCSFDKEKTTCFNLVGICSVALQMAAEVWWTCAMPQAITSEMRHKIQHDRDTKYNVMKSLLYVALDAIGDVTNKIKHKERSERKEDIWNIMDSFVRLAVIIDAWKGYRDLLYAITHFDMAASPFLERRFFSLCENIEIIYQEVPNEDILYWQKPQQGRFTLENESLQVDACPSIINASKTHLVHFTNSLVTSYDDRLMAVCSALVLNDSQNAQHTNIFVVNLSNGSVERVGLLSDGEQKLIPDDNPEVQPEQWRRTPCEFLQSAVAFKMMPRPEEISVAAMYESTLR